MVINLDKKRTYNINFLHSVVIKS